MSDISLVTILMKHINPSVKAQSAAQQSGGANANEDAGKVMAVAPQLIQDKVDLSPKPSAGSAQASTLHSPPGIQGKDSVLDGSGGQGNGQGQQSASPVNAANLANLSVPGRVSGRPLDATSMARLTVPTGQMVDMKV